MGTSGIQAPPGRVAGRIRKALRHSPDSIVLDMEHLEPLLPVLEMNLSETAFVSPEGDGFRLRWFTPKVEVDLCGHATLASAHVLFTHGYTAEPEVVFGYQGGTLTVAQDGELLVKSEPKR